MSLLLFLVFNVNFAVFPITSFSYSSYVFSPCLHNILYCRHSCHFFIPLSLMHNKWSLGTLSINVKCTSYFKTHTKAKRTQDLQREVIMLINYRLHCHNFMSPSMHFLLPAFYYVTLQGDKKYSFLYYTA